MDVHSISITSYIYLSVCVCYHVLSELHNVARTPAVVPRPLADVTVAPSVCLWINSFANIPDTIRKLHRFSSTTVL